MPSIPASLSKNIYCQRCNKRLYEKPAGTKWCHDCAILVTRENAAARGEHIKKLLARDVTVEAFPLSTANYACKVCGAVGSVNNNFCYRCGQRLRGGSNE